jgi:hypothetical protein
LWGVGYRSTDDARFLSGYCGMVVMEAVSERARFVSSSIPIEIVDDEELAAIETAFLQVSSVRCSLPHSKACSGSFGCAPVLQPKRSLAESANYWLRQCSSVQERGRNPGTGTFSVPLLEVHTISSNEVSLPSNALKAEAQSSSSCCKSSVLVECCRSHEKTVLVSSPSAGDESNLKGGGESNATRPTAQDGHPQGQSNEAAIPVVQDIEDLPGGKDAAVSDKEETPPEPKPRCLSVTDFTAFVRSISAAYIVALITPMSLLGEILLITGTASHDRDIRKQGYAVS